MLHHYHAVKNEFGDVVKVLMTGDPVSPQPIPLHGDTDGESTLTAAPITPQELLNDIDLVDLHHYMSDDGLAIFLENTLITPFVDVHRDVDLAVRTKQPVLLRALLKELDPEDCPTTFDHYGYRTMRAHHLGQSVARALDRALETSDSQTFEILLEHDTVVRTLLDNLPGYRSIVSGTPAMASLFDRGLSFAPADLSRCEQRFQTLSNRISVCGSTDYRTRNCLVEELFAITRSISIYEGAQEIQPIARNIARLALALGLGAPASKPLPFKDRSIELTRLIDEHCNWGHQRREPSDLESIAETVAILSSAPNQRYRLSVDMMQHCRTQARDWLRFPIPGWQENEVKVPHLSLSEVEAAYASEKTIFERLADQLNLIDNPQAKQASIFLAKTDPDHAIACAKEIMSQQPQEVPLPLPHRLRRANDVSGPSEYCAGGPSL